MPPFTPEMGLIGLFFVALAAATLLPGGSEAAFVAYLLAFPDERIAALCSASLGNTLGSLVTLAMGRFIPQTLPPQKSALVRRHGAPILALAWLPIVGDLLCLAAGWLRLPWLSSAGWIALGKSVRYGLIAAGMSVLG